MIFIERVEDEYFVRIDHSMTKEHYIAFVAAASSDDMPDRLAPVPAHAPAEGLIPINTAGADQLVLLPGVGPVLAGRIIEEREKNGAFRLPEDLLSVRGIGASTLEKILPLITLQEPE